jgi:hypothetical protein
MAPRLCPYCDLEMEHLEDEPDVGIVGGWHCSHCAISFSDDASYEDEPGDAWLMPG